MRRLSVIGLIGLVVFAGSVLHAEAQGQSIILAHPASTIDVLPLFVARDQGFFRDEGLGLRMVQIRADLLMKGLIAGNVDYGTAIGSTLGAAVSGMPVRAILSIAARPLFNLIAQPHITSIQGLRGKRIAVSSFGATSDYATRTLLSHNGINPDREVTILTMGESMNRFAALVAGSVDATVLVAPYDLRAQDRGYRLLGRSADVLELSQAGIGATLKKIREQPEQAMQVIRAALRGLEFTKRNRTGTMQTLMRVYRVEPELAGRVYEATLPGWEDNGIASDRAILLAIQLAKERLKITRAIGKEDVVYWGLVERVMAEQHRR